MLREPRRIQDTGSDDVLLAIEIELDEATSAGIRAELAQNQRRPRSASIVPQERFRATA
jgi:hypothetical protein